MTRHRRAGGAGPGPRLGPYLGLYLGLYLDACMDGYDAYVDPCLGPSGATGRAAEGAARARGLRGRRAIPGAIAGLR